MWQRPVQRHLRRELDMQRRLHEWNVSLHEGRVVLVRVHQRAMPGHVRGRQSALRWRLRQRQLHLLEGQHLQLHMSGRALPCAMQEGIEVQRDLRERKQAERELHDRHM